MQRGALRSNSEEIPLPLPQQQPYVISTSVLANKLSGSTSNDIVFLNGEVGNFIIHFILSIILNFFQPLDSSPSSTSSCGQNAESKRRRNIKVTID
jgi:hypothetical protein